MVALQTELSFSSSAVSSEAFGFARVTSASLLTVNARAEDTPSRDTNRASCTPTGASAAAVTRNLFASGLPSLPSLGLAVSLGVENWSSVTSSRFSPVMATSTVVPTCAPIGIVVSRRGVGRMTDWAKAEPASANQAIPAKTRTANLGDMASGCREIPSC